MRLPLIRRSPALPKATSREAKTKGRPSGPQPSTQKWIPVLDLIDGIIVTKDNRLLAVVRVEPAPFALLSEAEQERRIAGLRAAYQSLEEFQILSVGRPVDLDNYLMSLNERQREISGLKRRMLREYTEWVTRIARAGEALERRYYIVLSRPQSKTAELELRKSAEALVADLRQADLQAHVCDSAEVLDLLFVFFQPRQAAIERAEASSLTTLYERSW